jgi:pimeloyl-ACP methyl ester carboxylesterase
MPTTVIDGIATSFEVLGSGPPLLMYSPGGFDATMAKWTTQGIYKDIKPLAHLSGRYTCIVFDRRESGSSGGRVERVTWGHYVAQGKGLLEHLGFERAHLMGGCMGCPPVTAFAVAHPEMVRSMVLFWPVGGARYRLRGHGRFARHLTYAQESGLDGVAELAKNNESGFGKDPRVGPWGPVLRHDENFEKQFRTLDPEWYRLIVSGMVRTLLDRDTAPGAEPEDLMALDIPALIVPGQDASHATSAARYLEECLPGSQYWDVPVAGQTEENTPVRILEFLDSVA